MPGWTATGARRLERCSSANANPSTLANFGTEARWLDLHQTGNAREHYTYWWMTEMYHAEPRLPAIAGEPYYSGLYALGTPYALGKPGNTPADDMYVRSGMYGGLLSGGYAGYIYGSEGIWQASVEPRSRVFMWDAFQWSSAASSVIWPRSRTCAAVPSGA